MTGAHIPPVAILADAHFHDIEADYDCPGLVADGRRLTLRSWHDTARAARAFNESTSALHAALAAIRARGIRHVVLLGDYTDDGQAETTRRLATLLRRQTDLSFYALPGNHDVFGPHGKHIATRYSIAPGKTQLVTSDPVLAAQEGHAAILTPKLYCAGVPAGLRPMADFGLFRQPHYLHWETPFGTSDAPEARLHDARSADGQTTRQLMDASYLVEPVAGLWLLMIDANVFEPRNGTWREEQKRAYLDPATAGWNALLRVKPFLLPWIADVTARARAQGKHLLVLSHYPALDPFDVPDDLERQMFGETQTFLRTPGPKVAHALAAAGVRTHFSGHIHAYGITRRDTSAGPLTNISVPSLVAWPPGFVVAHPQGDDPRIETVSLAAMPRDTTILSVYRAEPPEAPEMLAAPDLGRFLLAQTRRRAILRDLPRDWPAHLAAVAPTATALHLACLMDGADRLDAPADPARHARLVRQGFDLRALAACALTNLIADWAVLKQAGPLAQGALSPDRLDICQRLAAAYANPAPDTSHADRAYFARFLVLLATALARLG